jgi:hypothetical protein
VVRVNLAFTTLIIDWLKNRHHLFFEPDHQQVYQLCQLAASMAIDLGITRRHTPSDSFNLLSVVAESNLKLASTQNAEAKRAFLGCYYLSST